MEEKDYLQLPENAFRELKEILKECRERIKAIE